MLTSRFFFYTILQNVGALSTQYLSIKHTLIFCEGKILEQSQRIKHLEAELDRFKSRLKKAATLLSKIKYWGIEMCNEITEYDFFHEVFMRQCENGFLVDLAREYQDGWEGLGKFCMDTRNTHLNAFGNPRPLKRQFISIPVEVCKDMQQQIQYSEERIKYLEIVIKTLRKDRPAGARPTDENEVEQLFAASNIEYATWGESSQAFQEQHRAIDEALQRQEDEAAARARYERRRNEERRSLRARARRRSNR